MGAFLKSSYRRRRRFAISAHRNLAGTHRKLISLLRPLVAAPRRPDGWRAVGLIHPQNCNRPTGAMRRIVLY